MGWQICRSREPACLNRILIAGQQDEYITQYQKEIEEEKTPHQFCKVQRSVLRSLFFPGEKLVFDIDHKDHQRNS